jgi:Ca2+-transporting ATPase
MNTQEKSKNWWLQSKQEISHNLNTDSDRGLSPHEAQKRLEKFGPNQLTETKRSSSLHLLLDQFSNSIVWILIAAAIIAGILGEWIDSIAIIAIIILNAFLGFFHEYRAEQSLAALKKLVNPTSKIMRDGKLQTLPSKDIVPGDLVLIEAGDRIPADGRFIQSFGLSTQESALTGESIPIHKTANPLLETCELSVGDKKNMGFLGTIALSGKGYMIITETGTHTELGKIASLLQIDNEEQTPFQIRLQKIGVRLVWFCLGIVSLVFALGFLKGTPLIENFLISISLAVAVIPEGLLAIVTIALSIGVHKMANRNALVRRLPSIETLGYTTVICTDKTGTLTQNEMAVRSIWINQTFIDVTGTGYHPEGNFEINHIAINPNHIPGLLTALRIGVLCNSADLHQVHKDSKIWEISGDPTEGALLSVAGKANLFKQDLDRENPLLSEIPFDSERKRMSMIRTTPTGITLFIKGAVDSILAHSTSILLNEEIHPLTIELKKNILDANAYLASQALRVLAVGYRPIPQDAEIAHSLEDHLIIVGLIAMMDPPRPEVKKSIEICGKAGIVTVMITGDHKDTAVAVAKELNLLKNDSTVVTGAELDQMDENSLKNRLQNIAIYARTSAIHKLRIVHAWKSLGAIVAMTGDGVNDAPALKEADIGIAMGITGTDVTKEASDIVISDDNFASIVSAIEEGRGIQDNITKFVCYLASSNIAEILVVLMGMIVGFTDFSGNPFVPLSAVQILWINLASDGFPAIAIGLDPIDPKGMEKSPKKPSDPIIPRKRSAHLLLLSVIIAIGTLAACYFGIHQSGELAQTMAFTTLVILELMAVQIIRAPYNVNILSNPYIIVAMGISFLLQLLIVYTPFLQGIFHTVPLHSTEWVIISAITVIAWILCMLTNRVLKTRT